MRYLVLAILIASLAATVWYLSTVFQTFSISVTSEPSSPPAQKSPTSGGTPVAASELATTPLPQTTALAAEPAEQRLADSNGLTSGLPANAEAPSASAAPSPHQVPAAPDSTPTLARAEHDSIRRAVDGKHPERRTALIAPAPFDLRAYLADQDGYCNLHEPGRVFQSLRAGKDVPALVVIGSARYDIGALGSCTLVAKAIPNAPVTFGSSDGGIFANHLPSMTIRADTEGVVKAEFTANAGTTGPVNILAGCPMTSGQLLYLVEVSTYPSNSTTANP